MQEIKRIGATAGARLEEFFTPEEEASNAIAQQQENAQPAKSLTATEQEMLEKSGPLCVVLAKHNWLIVRMLASLLGRDEYVLPREKDELIIAFLLLMTFWRYSYLMLLLLFLLFDVYRLLMECRCERLAKAVVPLLSLERPPLRLLRLLIDEEIARTSPSPLFFLSSSIFIIIINVFNVILSLLFYS